LEGGGNLGEFRGEMGSDQTEKGQMQKDLRGQKVK
jgi:hypothetical protein